MSATKKGRPTAARPQTRGTKTAGVTRKPARPARAGGTGTAGRPAKGRAEAPPAQAWVTAEVPLVARIIGGLAVLGSLLLLVAPGFDLVTEDSGSGAGAAPNILDFAGPLLVAAVVGGAGALCVLGRLPRLGLAVIVGAGVLSIGLLIQTLYLYDSAARSSRDLPLPIALVRTFPYDPATGIRLLVAAYVLFVAALVLTCWAWPRTWMEDEGGFDALRPRFAGLGFLVGFVAVMGVYLEPSTSDLTGFAQESLVQRDGLDAVGGVVLAGALVICSVLAPSLRPRLAVVGMYLGLFAIMGGYALRNALLVARSTFLDTSPGGVAQFVGALGFALLALGAWRMSRQPVPE